jgi:F-type H+-transporting ATPase subunit delta
VARGAYAKRYAQAAFEIALEAGELERWKSDLQKVVRAVSDEDFSAVLESPKVPFDEKSSLLSGQIKNPLLLNLLLMLISKGRLSIIDQIAEEYGRLLNRHHGIEVAKVTTAMPLAKEDEAKLARRLERIVGKKVEIKAGVDPNVIGGFVARIGDRLLDGSLRSRLTALKKEMVGK